MRIKDLLASNRIKSIQMPIRESSGDIGGHENYSNIQNENAPHIQNNRDSNIENEGKKNKNNKMSRSPDLNDILDVVQANDKKRFQIREEKESGDHHYWIRAVQGHSLQQVSTVEWASKNRIG